MVSWRSRKRVGLRRRAGAASKRRNAAGFGATEAGKVAIVATELATNLIKHGGGGEILVATYEEPGSSGIELIALDRGRGIADLAGCLADGYSSAGTLGQWPRRGFPTIAC